MKIRINTDRENKRIILGIWLLICAGAKFVQLNFLSAKYSYDGRRIFSEASTGYRSGDKGYDTAANFFAILNKIFHMNSYDGWAILLGVVGSIILLVFLRDSLKSLYLMDFLFLSCSLFLMNVYIFNVGKEIVQMLILLPAIYILQCKCNEKTKVIVVLISLLCIAVFLRTYFALTAAIFCIVYMGFSQSTSEKKKKFFRRIMLVLFVGIVGLYFLQKYMPNIYEKMLFSRESVNRYRIGSKDAQTMIVDVLNNDGSIAIYVLNLMINLIRLMFPISLVREGIFQILFLVYQIILSVKLVQTFYKQSKGKRNENTFIAVSLLLAYFIVAAIFEPDYGSVIRHEMALFPIIYIALFQKNCNEL